MRVPNFPLAPSPDQFCPHHRHSLINMDDASSQLSQLIESCRRQQQQSSYTIFKARPIGELKGLRGGERKAESVASLQLPSSDKTPDGMRSPEAYFGGHTNSLYVHTKTTNFCSHELSRFSLSCCLFRYGFVGSFPASAPDPVVCFLYRCMSRAYAIPCACK